MPSDGGDHTQGVENIDGTIGFATPGRNSQNWSASNDFVAYYPNGTNSYTIDQTGTFAPFPMSGSVNVPSTCGLALNWTTGATSTAITVAPTQTTTYGVTYSDNLGCARTATITIQILSSSTPTITVTENSGLVSNDSVICSGDNVILAVPAGFTSYNWSTGATSSAITVMPTVSTTYTVSTVSTTGVTGTASVFIEVNPVSSLTITAGSTEICVGESVSLTASGGLSTYIWSTGATTTSITTTPTQTTDYTLTEPDPFGCAQTVSQTVTVNGLPTPISGGASVCIGEATTLTASGGASYLWSTGSTSSSISVMPSVTTTYSVTVTSSNGCSAMSTATVTVNPLPIPSISGTNVLCFGESTTLTVSGGALYAWSNGSSATSITVSPTATTTYSVLVTDANGCQASTSQTVTVNPLPTPSISGTNVLCFGESTTLTVSGGTSYAWSTGQTIASVFVTPATSTTYVVDVTDAEGCSASTSILITVNPLPALSVSGSRVICFGESTTLTASGGSSYVWSEGSTSAALLVSPTLTTTYSVTATSLSGCPSATDVTVVVNPLPVPVLTASVTEVCIGTSVSLTASGGTSFSWNTGATSASLTLVPTSTFTYVVDVSDANGCPSATSLTVVVNPLPTATIGISSLPICEGESTTLTGSGAPNLLWNTGSTSATLTVSPTVTTTYDLTVTDVNACTDAVSLTVVVNPLPVPVLTASATEVCIGTTVNLTASGGTAYAWNTGATSANLTLVPTSTFTYVVDVTDANGCPSATSLTVVVNPLPATPTITPSASVICVGDAVTLNVAGSDTYDWTGGTTNFTGISFTDSPVTTTTYTVTATDANGCQSSATTTITVNPLPTTSLALTESSGVNDDARLCSNALAPVTLTASGATSYVWSTGQTGNTITVNPNATTDYSVTGSNAGGCALSVTQTITVVAAPRVEISQSSTLCVGETVTLSSSGSATSFLWNTTQTSANINVRPSAATTYILEGTDGNGCANTASLTVTPNALPTVSLTGVVRICEGDGSGGVLLSPLSFSPNNVTFEWTAAGSPNVIGTTESLSVTTAGLYTLTVRHPNGCTASDAVEFIIADAPVVGLPADTALCDALNFTATLNAYDVAHGFLDIEYGWYETTVSGVPLSQDSTYDIAGAGTYIVVVEDNASGCQSLDTVNVTTTVTPIFQLGGHTPPVCEDLDTLEILATNVLNYNVSWSGPLGGITQFFDTSGGDSLQAEVSASGIYSVTISNTGNGLTCGTTEQIEVQLEDLPLNIAEDTTFCGTGEYRLIAQDLSQFGSNVSYEWTVLGSSQVLSTDPNVTVSGAGIYVVSVTNNDFNCTKSDTVQVRVNPVPGAVITGYSGGTCAESETLQLEATNALNYAVSWDGPGVGNPSADGLQIEATQTGNYTVRVTDPNTGCSGTDAVFVQLGDFPTVNLADTVSVCQTERLTLDASDASHLPTFTYAWNVLGSGQTLGREATLEVSNTAGGTRSYVVRVTPPSGCATLDTIEVSFDAPAAAGLATFPREICQGETATLTAGGGDTFAWSTGETTASIAVTPDTTGVFTYIAVVSNEGSVCPSSQVTAEIEVQALPVLELTQSSFTLCQTETAFLSAEHFSHDDVTYAWINPSGFVVNNTADYTFAYDDILPSPTFNTQRYTITVLDNQTGCSTSRTVEVTFDRLSEVRILNNFAAQVCQGDSVTFTATGAQNYLWSTGATDRQITVGASTLGQQIISVAGNFENNCPPSEAIVTYQVQPRPTVEILGADTIQVCEGARITLEAAGGATYFWSDGSTSASLTTLPQSSPFGYRVIGYNELGCADTANVVLELQPTAQFPNYDPVCPEVGSLTIGAIHPDTTVNATYFWENGNRNAQITVTRTGTYTVEITAGECVYERTANVRLLAPLSIRFPADTFFCIDGVSEFDLLTKIETTNGEQAIYYDLYSLTPADSTVSDSLASSVSQTVIQDRAAINQEFGIPVRLGDTTLYLRVETEFGCVQFDSVDIRSICPPRVKLPDAFTPNSDNLNDTFAPLTSGLRRLQLRIFNRYGTVVYEVDLDKGQGWDGVFMEEDGWDGTYNGTGMPSGTYLYQLIWRGFDPDTGRPLQSEESGELYLLRSAE